MGKQRLDPRDDMFFTRTMAELLEEQGHMEDALMIYKILSDSDPSDAALKEKIAGLKDLAGRRRASVHKRRG